MKLTRGGAYTSQARALARTLVKNGCAMGSVASVVAKVAKTFGVSVDRSMSRRSVSRAVLEGGIAAKIQLGYEISQAQSNGDGTSHKHTNFEARHVALKVASYGDPSATRSHKIRLLGVDSSVDHSSETQLQGWKDKVLDMSSTFSESPLAKRLETQLRPDDFARKVVTRSM
ncbi:hypothetical protein FA95DRAFT_1486152 [Auriscalpium vulgare]|uniref:Uncharacterized protein n=1 Tax=Auriscalpium vulgare TaxID=40419 RepID=A0ACB8S4M5_9AGAM|nr:hypothetical protein FA95DRAFT_1486152 [Auriscalpium vulgare]